MKEKQKYDTARCQNMMLETSPGGIIALSYTIMETLQPMIKDRRKLYFEQANGCLSSYYFCRRALKKVSELCDMGGEHKRMFDFFSKELNNDYDRLSWIGEALVDPVECQYETEEKFKEEIVPF